jgi:hydrogenase/urease accessory protein HupE
MHALRKFLPLLVALAFVPALRAHDPGLSSVRFERHGTEVEMQAAFAWTDLARLLEDAPKIRPKAAQLATLTPALSNVTDRFARLMSHGNSFSPVAIAFGPDTATTTDVLVHLTWTDVPAGEISVTVIVLSQLPFGHRMLVNRGTTAEAIGILDARHAGWILPDEAQGADAPPVTLSAPANPPAAWFSFVLLGIEHILTGYDHLCFLLALLLVARRFRDVLGVITTFTVAHSLTLVAAALKVVSLSPAIVEPLIAASIIYVGVENLILRRQPRHRLALVFGFGLIHGLGFASALAERLPGITGLAIIPPLLSFNLGVEAGQLAVAAVLVPLIILLRSRANYLSLLQPALSCLIAGFGLFWFAQRVWPG